MRRYTMRAGVLSATLIAGSLAIAGVDCRKPTYTCTGTGTQNCTSTSGLVICEAGWIPVGPGETGKDIYSYEWRQRQCCDYEPESYALVWCLDDPPGSTWALLECNASEGYCCYVNTADTPKDCDDGGLGRMPSRKGAGTCKGQW